MWGGSGSYRGHGVGPGLGVPIGSTGGLGGPIGDSGCPLYDPHVPPPSSVLLPRPRHRRGHGDRLPRGPRGGFRAERGPIRHPRRRRVSTGAKKTQNPIFSPQKIPLFQPKKKPQPRRILVGAPLQNSGTIFQCRPRTGRCEEVEVAGEDPRPPQKKRIFWDILGPRGSQPVFL